LATLYLDTDISHKIIPPLLRDGRVVLTTHSPQLPLNRRDADQLLTAVDRDAVLVTHNRWDFVLIERTWQLLAERWHVAEHHAGILIPRQTSAEAVYRQLEEFLSSGRPVAGLCWVYLPATGWTRWQ
jgi:hypothetical protein